MKESPTTVLDSATKKVRLDDRSKIFVALFYCEWDLPLGQRLQAFADSHPAQIVAILHPAEDGEGGHKEHVHCVIRCPSRCRASAIQRALYDGVDTGNQTFVRPCSDEAASVRYLLHWGHPDKTQFNVNDLIFTGVDSRTYFSRYLDSRRLLAPTLSILTRIRDSGAKSYKSVIETFINDGDEEALGFALRHAYAVNLLISQYHQSLARSCGRAS